MKKTLIALMALASVAMGGGIDFEYDFTGDTPWAPTTGSGGTQNQTSGWSAADGNLTFSGTANQWSGLYLSGKPNGALYSAPSYNEWAIMLTATIMPQAANDVGLFQLFGQGFSTNFSSCGLFVGSDDSFGFKLRFGGDTNTVGTIVTFSVTSDALQEIGVSAVSGTSLDYGLSYRAGKLAVTIGSIDVTSSLTFSSTDTSMAEVGLSELYNSQGYEGLTVKKLGYGNEFGGHGVGTGTVLSKFSIIPEPATATLSLLALAGLAARRRRK